MANRNKAAAASRRSTQIPGRTERGIRQNTKALIAQTLVSLRRHKAQQLAVLPRDISRAPQTTSASPSHLCGHEHRPHHPRVLALCRAGQALGQQPGFCPGIPSFPQLHPIRRRQTPCKCRQLLPSAPRLQLSSSSQCLTFRAFSLSGCRRCKKPLAKSRTKPKRPLCIWEAAPVHGEALLPFSQHCKVHQQELIYLVSTV